MEWRDFWRSRRRGEKFYPWIAYISKQTGRPVKMMLPKDQELAHLKVKPQTLSKFKVGATKDGKIIAMPARVPRQYGRESGRGARGKEAGRSELYLHVVPNWREIGFLYGRIRSSRARRAAIPSRSSSGPGNR